jgi:hypothetical protein
MLTKMGYHNSGNQLFYNGFTGEQIYSEIFVGQTYYMRLKHMVKDKINYRATGKRNFLTRQTNQGRANDGGLKIGEMERDGIMAHGLSYFLNESYMVRGDQYFMGVCNKTGAIAVYNPDTNLFLSPFADGPLVFNKNIEGQEVLNAISKFGRSFSIVRIPFALKLLIQELQVMNIQMRIITEDNIDQLLNLSYQSRNIDKLLHIDHGEDGKTERDIKDIIDDYKKTLEKLNQNQADKNLMQRYQMAEPIAPQNIEYTPDNEDLVTSDTPPYAPFSPAYSGYDVDKLLENELPEQSSENPPWDPPFDMPEKNEIFYSLPKYVQDNIMKTVDQEMWWSAVDDAHKKMIEDKTGFLVKTPEGSPEIKGGSKIFNDPYMNEAFNQLGGEHQSKILQLPQVERGRVMSEIMRRSQNDGTSESNSLTINPLKEAFDALPTDKQFVALQGGYSSMAKEFNNLAKTTPDALVTIKTPIPMSQTLAEQFPLLFEQKGGNKTLSEISPPETNSITNNEIENENENEKSSSDTNNSSSNEHGGTKIIKI